MDALDRFCHALPKVELHVHLLGAVLRPTFAEFAARAGMGEAETESLYARDARPKGVLHILRALEQRLLRRPADLHRITYEHLAEAASHNVRHSEIFWNPTGTAHLFSYREGAEAILAGFADAAVEFGVSALLIPAIDREDTPERAVEMVEWMIAHRRDAIIGLGIDYREPDGPPERFWKAFRMAKQAGFRITAHAGEFGCHPRNVETAVDLCGAERLDHGYTVLEDPALTRRFAEAGIVFTVVPTNSFYLRTLAPERWARDHPIPRMPGAGLLIHPNTDDPPLHRVTPTRCWRMMAEDFGFGREALRGFTLNGIAGSFLPDAAKRHLFTAYAEEFDALEFPAA
ncbi:adenosine deaminase family protein [Sabulicella glaciei]|uniref:Adenosine deaminase n=1 Tax=Sabulicella glaciei TaxID=2984948 RepID=A0ABT3NRM8_9PROT|nr:adenosine deaminase [Roseococcus sp. MDT2-1-1]MCW8084821.1 adenosine deaminase [Roseococcus sp. MDT2-1-1]